MKSRDARVKNDILTPGGERKRRIHRIGGNGYSLKDKNKAKTKHENGKSVKSQSQSQSQVKVKVKDRNRGHKHPIGPTRT
ncbi:hypothetical protein Tco_1280657 [Tanacetum coccineum]